MDCNTAIRKATTIPGLSPAHVAFGDAIRATRKEQGVSQEALALKCGLDRSYFGAVERGERNVSLTNIIRIAEALQARPADLFARAESTGQLRAT
ncbi:MAG TPA: helix-turn-helix transcriptional regulator [Solirubrobacteraceae bacterium]|nr:helix-turn-helix transcriptional regulator [Solirubrobacteraceae bacterium]